jgi:drug/metabolite transporter (DMT)-like permease
MRDRIRQRPPKANPTDNASPNLSVRGFVLPTLLAPASVQPRLTAIKPLRWLACVLILAGAFMLLASALLQGIAGQVPAVAMLFLVFGLICAFPTVLTDGGDQVSSMRAVVLMIGSTFVLLTVKNCWSNPNALVDPSWKTILLAALGGKAVQSFAESMSGPRPASKLGSPDYAPPSPPRPGQA